MKMATDPEATTSTNPNIIQKFLMLYTINSWWLWASCCYKSF